MKSNINARLTNVSLTYILFIALVLIPNFVLGIYGYTTIRGQETDAETNMKNAFEIIAKTFISEINAEIEKMDENVLKAAKYETTEEMISSFNSLLQNYPSYKHIIYIDEDGNFTFQASADEVTKEKFEKKFKNVLLSRLEDYAGKYPARFILTPFNNGNPTTFLCFNAILTSKRCLLVPAETRCA